MGVADLMTRSATLLRYADSGEVDEYGDAVKTLTETSVSCELQQQRRNEDDEQAEVAESRWRLFLPAGTEVDTGDAIEVGGDRYELVGEPWPVHNPRTEEISHIEATVRRVAGAGD